MAIYLLNENERLFNNRRVTGAARRPMHRQGSSGSPGDGTKSTAVQLSIRFKRKLPPATGQAQEVAVSPMGSLWTSKASNVTAQPLPMIRCNLWPKCEVNFLDAHIREHLCVKCIAAAIILTAILLITTAIPLQWTVVPRLKTQPHLRLSQAKPTPRPPTSHTDCPRSPHQPNNEHRTRSQTGC